MTRESKRDRSGKEASVQDLVRSCYRSGGYVFASKAEDISEKYGTTRIARLASNENPRSPPERAIEQGCRALADANRYPDETMRSLTKALRLYHGNDYSFVTGVGMDGVIETLTRTLVDPGDGVAISTPTFSFYRLAALAQAAQVVEIPRGPDFSVDPELFVRKAGKVKISFLCSPNNPTGTVTPIPDIEHILTHIDGILFLDCAYVEFSDTDYRPLMQEYTNLVIGRTMSKVFALAGARVGYAFVPSWLAPFYLRASTPFVLNAISAQAAIGALEERSFVDETIAHARYWRKRYEDEIKYPVFPSGANFVMVDVAPFTGDEMVALLAEQGVIVRSCASFTGLANKYIRVSIGLDRENEQFLAAINSI
ncbi:MAG: histidinol-phosphate transaminase [Methanoregulaceae archaeon]|nr:histidinol-phosphate transaminase [Methanoregulaceae archaeon]